VEGRAFAVENGVDEKRKGRSIRQWSHGNVAEGFLESALPLGGSSGKAGSLGKECPKDTQPRRVIGEAGKGSFGEPHRNEKTEINVKYSLGEIPSL